jgi:hypothetical protein
VWAGVWSPESHQPENRELVNESRFPFFPTAVGTKRSLRALRAEHRAIPIHPCASPEKMLSNHNLAFRNRKALPMTETELKLNVALAMIGLSSKPKKG